MKKAIQLLLILSVMIASVSVFAQDPIVYPNKSQTPEQMEMDKYSCYQWAKKESGFDPMVKPTASIPPPKQEAKRGGVGRGAARGALIGLAVGSLSGEAGKGAAIGATSGGLIGGMRRKDQAVQQEKADQEWAQQQAAEYNQKRNFYNRAYGACLEGRGYTVK